MTGSAELNDRHVLYLLVTLVMFVFDAVLIGATWLLSPTASILLAVAWLAGVAVAAATWRKGPWVPLAASVGVSVVWLVTVSIGVVAGGWR